MSDSKIRLIIVGAGGHARVVASVLKYYSEFEVLGIADRDEKNIGEIVSQYKIISGWEKWKTWKDKGIRHLAIAIGNNHERAKIFNDMVSVGFIAPTLVHPKAFVEETAVLGEGTLVCAGAIIGAGTHVEKNSIINTGSIIDHDGRMGRHIHIAPGAVIAGRVEIGDYSFVGTGVRIIDKIKVGRNVVIGAGSVVIEDIPDNVTAVGVPARLI